MVCVGITNLVITICVAIRTKEEHNHQKPPILLGYFNPFSACNCTECMIVYSYMTNKNTMNNNLTIVRNIAYSQINKINKKIKEEIEVDNVLIKRIDINMKNAINKILHDYKLQQ